MPALRTMENATCLRWYAGRGAESAGAGCGALAAAPTFSVSNRSAQKARHLIDKRASGSWWRWGDSNPRPLTCEASALPAELHPQGRERLQQGVPALSKGRVGGAPREGAMPVLRAAAAVLASLVLASCGQGAGARAGGPLRVLATTTTLASIAEGAAGPTADVRSLVPVGVSPEDYQPSPQDAAKLRDADVLIENGAGLEGWLDAT